MACTTVQDGREEILDCAIVWAMQGRGSDLAFTRYWHYQYCMACTVVQDGREETLGCTIVWAMQGRGSVLAFTRYWHYQYCMACTAVQRMVGRKH